MVDDNLFIKFKYHNSNFRPKRPSWSLQSSQRCRYHHHIKINMSWMIMVNNHQLVLSWHTWHCHNQQYHNCPNQYSLCSIIIYNQGSGHFEGLAILWEDGTKVEAAANWLKDRYQMQNVRLSDAIFSTTKSPGANFKFYPSLGSFTFWFVRTLPPPAT